MGRSLCTASRVKFLLEGRPNASRPKLFGRERRPIGKCLEFQPGDFGIDRQEVRESGESTIGSGYDTLATDNVGEPDDPFSNKLRVFDIIGAGVDDTGHKHLVLRNGHLFKHAPFMGVAWVGSLEEKSLGAKAKYEIDDVGQGDVVIMRPFIIAPAKMDPKPVGGNITGGMIDYLNPFGHLLPEFPDFEHLMADMPSHREIRGVNLKQKAGLVNGLKFRAHSFSERFDIRVFAGIELVFQEYGDDAGRRGTDESVGSGYFLRGGFKIANILVDRVFPPVADRASTSRRSAPQTACSPMVSVPSRSKSKASAPVSTTAATSIVGRQLDVSLM